jgi:xanthine dehydrogenase small subunit
MAAKQKSATGGDAIRFVLDGEVCTVDDAVPTTTVLNFLRERLGRTGTKEGCAEGDCGACTVVLAELEGEGVRFRAVNSCIQFLPTLDGKELITVESLKGPDGALHPVQQALVDCHGSQCGFCTPGFVMSLFALYKTARLPTRAEIGDALSGNLCRCTGYRPIVDAGVKMYEYGGERQDRHQSWMNCSFSSATDREMTQSEREMIERLRAIRRRDTLVVRQGAATFYAPVTLKDLATLREEHSEARMLAGGTDVGLWVTKQHKDLPTIIYTGDVAELKEIHEAEGSLEIGAAANLTDAYTALVRHHPELSELYRRFASPPIRNAGTLGGNIANGSPIGDSMPALMVMGTTLVLRKGKKSRELSLDEFYVAYQKTALEPGEFVERIRVPHRAPDAHLRTYKISKRFDQDISAVCGAFLIVLKRGRIESARIAYGGMAATPKRASAAERALTGREWNESAVRAAMASLADDYAPLTDMRATGAYRKSVARNLLHKFWIETSGTRAATQVVEFSI